MPASESTISGPASTSLPSLSDAARAFRFGRYVHYSGRRYEAFALGRDEATLREIVVYRGEDGAVWARPLSVFGETVERHGARMPRFAYAGKLVRDGIPGIIAAKGESCDAQQADGEEYRRLLAAKLREEAGEFAESGSPEELADVLEVIEAICEEKGVSFDAVRSLQRKKREERGGFARRMVLLR